MAKITPPIPQDKIGENFVWRDWFQRLSDKVFGTMGTQDSSNVSITGGTIDVSSLTTNNLYIPTGTDGQVLIGSTSSHGFTPATLTAGTNISVTNAPGSITISSTSGGVTSVTATSPVASTGGTTPVISMPVATGSVSGYLSSTDWTTFNNKGSGDVVGPASATDNAVVRFDTTTGKLIQNSVTTIDDTGNASGILSQQFNNGSAVTLAAGKVWYNGSTGAWNMGMGNGNITQQVGEELFIYGKASAAITDSPLQIVYHTGTVGASGVVKFAPTIAGITDNNAIVGIATESLALNDFGRVTTFGTVRGITTNGTAFGETWADDDPIWYNPVTGNPTNVQPVAPNIKIQVGLVINAGSGGSGSFHVEINRGSTLGGTDSNVQLGTLANKDLLAYSTSLGYWTNSTFSSLGVGSVTSVALALPSIMSVSGSPVTSSGTLTGTLTTQSVNTLFAGPNSGAAATPTFRALTTSDIPSLSYVTSVALALPSILTVSGSPVTSSGTLTGTLTTQAVNVIFAGPSSGASAAPTFRSLTTADIPTLNQNTTGTAANVTGTVAISNGGTGNTTATAAFNALAPVTTTGDLIIGNGTNSSTRLGIGANNYVLTSNGTTASWAVATGSGATITNDTSTATNLYPLFSSATSGALTNVYTGNANYLFKPSTGELTSIAMISSNGIQINSATVATSYTIATGNNGLSAGPVSINTSVTVTVSTGSRWTVV